MILCVASSIYKIIVRKTRRKREPALVLCVVLCLLLSFLKLSQDTAIVFVYGKGGARSAKGCVHNQTIRGEKREY